MKMFRVAVMSNKNYRGKVSTMYKAIVLAKSKEDALAKVTASEHGHSLEEIYIGGRIVVSEIEEAVYSLIR